MTTFWYSPCQGERLGTVVSSGSQARFINAQDCSCCWTSGLWGASKTMEDMVRWQMAWSIHGKAGQHCWSGERRWSCGRVSLVSWCLATLSSTPRAASNALPDPRTVYISTQKYIDWKSRSITALFVTARFAEFVSNDQIDVQSLQESRSYHIRSRLPSTTVDTHFPQHLSWDLGARKCTVHTVEHVELPVGASVRHCNPSNIVRILGMLLVMLWSSGQ